MPLAVGRQHASRTQNYRLVLLLSNTGLTCAIAWLLYRLPAPAQTRSRRHNRTVRGPQVTRRVEQPLAQLRVWDAGVRRGRALLEQWKARARRSVSRLSSCAAARMCSDARPVLVSGGARAAPRHGVSFWDGHIGDAVADQKRSSQECCIMNGVTFMKACMHDVSSHTVDEGYLLVGCMNAGGWARPWLQPRSVHSPGCGCAEIRRVSDAGQ